MISEKLLKLFHKSSKKFPSSKIAVVLLVALVMLSVSVFPQDGTGDKVKENTLGVQQRVEVKSKIFPSPTKVPQISKKVMSVEITSSKFEPSPTSTPAPSVVSQANQSNPSGSSGLLTSVNSYRASNGLSSVAESANLCGIANKRLGEIISLGALDHHAGFDKYLQGQNEFSGMGEILFSSSNPTSPDFAVNEGWAKSPSHRENMSNPSWNYGCGATNSYFSVFNFGKK